MSKTIIANALVVAVSIGTALLGNSVIQSHPNWIAIITGAVGVMNIVLRYFSDQPMVGWLMKGPKPPARA
jgi:hypothetical protein